MHVLVCHVGVELGVSLGTLYVDALLLREFLEFGSLPLGQPPLGIRKRAWGFGIEVLGVADLFVFPLLGNEDFGTATHLLLHVGRFEFLFTLWHGLFDQALETIFLGETLLLDKFDIEEISRSWYFINLELSDYWNCLFEVLVGQNVQVSPDDPLVSILDLDMTAIHQLKCFVLETHLDETFEQVAVLSLGLTLLHLTLDHLLHQLLNVWQVRKFVVACESKSQTQQL